MQNQLLMTRWPSRYLMALFLVLVLWACEDRSSTKTIDPENGMMTIDLVDDMMTEEMPAILNDMEMTACESVRRPLVLIHGFLASGDTWNRQIQRLEHTGSCREWVRAYDWNSLDMGGDHLTALDELIDQLIRESSYEQVDLVGHSAGGGISYQYLEDLERAQKVHKYVHIASFPSDRPAGRMGEIPTLNLWSSADTVVEGADIPDATNRMLESLDHYLIATSFDSFNIISAFLYEDPPLSEDPLSLDAGAPTESIKLSGRLLSLGENLPNQDTLIKIWALNEGSRTEELGEIQSDQQGYFETFDLPAQGLYELMPNLEAQELPKVRYFLPRLQKDQPAIYLRTFPGANSLANLIVRQLPQSSEQASIVIFNAHRAFLAGQDSIKLNGEELLNEEVASAEDTAIALFIFDANADGEDGGTLPIFEGFPFLSFIDYPLIPESNANYEIDFNGQKVFLPRESSDQGTLLVIFP